MEDLEHHHQAVQQDEHQPDLALGQGQLVPRAKVDQVKAGEDEGQGAAALEVVDG